MTTDADSRHTGFSQGRSHAPGNVIRLHREPAQVRIVIDFDVPAHKVNSPDVRALLDAARQIAERAVESAYGEAIKATGCVYVGSSVEQD